MFSQARADLVRARKWRANRICIDLSGSRCSRSAPDVAALCEIWRTLVFLGIAKFTFVGNEVSFTEAQWGHAFFAILLAAIWIWVAEGFWNVRAYAWSFGIFISLFTIIFGFFALLGNAVTMESEAVGWSLAILIFFYLNYPGVRDQFVAHEMSLLTPEQKAAMEQMQAAQAQMAAATAASQAAPPAAPGRSSDSPGAPGTAGKLGRRSDEPDPQTRVGLVAFSGQAMTGAIRSMAASVGMASVASSQAMSGSERNHVRWRLAKATLRWASRSIAASLSSSPSRTAHASR